MMEPVLVLVQPGSLKVRVLVRQLARPGPAQLGLPRVRRVPPRMLPVPGLLGEPHQPQVPWLPEGPQWKEPLQPKEPLQWKAQPAQTELLQRQPWLPESAELLQRE